LNHNDQRTLQRLLGRRETLELMQSIEASIPGIALALARTDGTFFVGTDLWYRRTGLRDAATLISALDPAQIVQRELYRLYPLFASSQLVGAMIVCDDTGAPSRAMERAIYHSLNLLLTEALEKRKVAAEALERYREINLMYRVSETIGTLLDVEKIPGLVLEESKRAIRADAGAVFLYDGDDASFQLKASFGLDCCPQSLYEVAPGALGAAWQSDRPAIVTDFAFDIDYRALLWAPLKTQDHVLGGIVLGRALAQPVFTASDEKLLMALARQAAVAVDNARLHQAVLEKERLEHELELARQVQASFIPRTTPNIPGWDFAAFWEPARQVSGDFYDFIDHVGASDHAPLSGIVIADVSDKGMHAALFMTLTRSVMRAATTAHQSPADSVTQSNRLLCADSTGGMFVTLFYAQLDSAKNEMTYVNAGHNPPLLYRARTQTLIELTRTGIMLGFDAAMPFEQRRAQFEQGDFIVLYTDGVTEALNARDEQFGEERLRTVIYHHCSASPAIMLQALRNELSDFVGNRLQSDDITIVIVKCVGSET
jgi:serine phosphatase RsbU (regulator of sigma subunit)